MTATSYTSLLPTEILVDGITYRPEAPKSDDIRIVVLQRGWVVIGRWSTTGDMCAVDDASVIRVWGTTKGLGELRSGPTPSTTLDPCGRVECAVLAVVMTLDTVPGAWSL